VDNSCIKVWQVFSGKVDNPWLNSNGKIEAEFFRFYCAIKDCNRRNCSQFEPTDETDSFQVNLHVSCRFKVKTTCYVLPKTLCFSKAYLENRFPYVDQSLVNLNV